MVIYHGWGDPLVTPFLTIAYYESMAKIAGGMSAAQGFARLFMIPGMDHCGINAAGPSIGDTGIDPLSGLEAWVEHGAAPQTLLATKTDGQGKTLWQRPICAYPNTAKLTGGDPQLATSWTCTPP
jgi:feruloyl esterase